MFLDLWVHVWQHVDLLRLRAMQGVRDRVLVHPFVAVRALAGSSCASMEFDVLVCKQLSYTIATRLYT